MTVGSPDFEVGAKTLQVGGSIIPSASAAPRYDLGSLSNPWRDIYFSPSSLHFESKEKGVEFWMGELERMMVTSVRHVLKYSIDNYVEIKRTEWCL